MVTLATSDHNICQTNTGVGRLISANLAASLERLSEVQDLRGFHVPEETSSDSFLESLQNQLYWTTRLLIKRHIFVYSPYEIIYSAQELTNELHKATMQSRLSTPFDLHSLALASMTLLEATVLPEYASECWEALNKVEEILDRRTKRYTGVEEFQDVFATPGWDNKIRIFLEWRRAKSQESQLHDPNLTKNNSHNGNNGAAVSPPVMGPNEQRSLQHLADLAVGAEGSVAANANASSPPPALQENNLNASEVHAQGQQGRMVVDFTLLTKEGYLNVFSGLIYRRQR